MRLNQSLLILLSLPAIFQALEENSYKSKIREFYGNRGKISFDDTITEDVAKHIFDSIQANNNHMNRRMFDSSTGTWNNTDKSTVLDLHNYYRSQTALGKMTDDGTNGYYPTASNMNSFFWDNAIADVAQTYSDGCSYAHNSNRNTEFYSYTSQASFVYPSSDIYLGENIAALYTTSSTYDESYLTGRVDDWVAENVDYHYQTTLTSAWYSSGAGHFTQVMWAETRYVGCGFSRCDSGGYTMYYLVCDYYPGGNYMGSSVYINGTNYASCDADRTEHSSGLCSGCMSPSYTYNGSTLATDCSSDIVSGGSNLSASSKIQPFINIAAFNFIIIFIMIWL